MIELRTLGALELTSADSTAVGSVLAQPRRAALLCYLALASPRGFQRRDTLFALFWPEYDAEQARHALRQSVYFLRRSLGSETIVSRGDEELALAPEKVRCDVWDFEAALEEGRPAEAFVVYGGDLLAGFHISEAPEFERWLEEERSRLKRRAEEAGWSLAAAREREGDAAGAADAARSAAALAPTDETALRRLVLLLERVGDRAAAVRAYEAFAGNLKEEYELEPSAETQALVARIRAEPGPKQPAAKARGGRLSPAAGNRDPNAGIAADLAPSGNTLVLNGSVRNQKTSVQLTAPLPAAVSHPPRSVLLGAAALGLVLLIGLYLFSHQRGPGSGPTEALAADGGSSIAILPFEIRGAGFETWGEGMVDLLSVNLSGVPGVRTVHSRTVLARWRERVKNAGAADLETALEVASRTGARYAVIGSVVTSGRGMRLNAGVYDVPRRRMIRTGQVEGPTANIFGLVDQLSLEVLRVALPERKQDMSRFGLVRATTSSLPALKAYLEGEALFRASDFENAGRAYSRAVKADSTFALAWARLWLAQSWAGTDPPDSLVLVNAARFAERLPAHEAALIRAGIASRDGRLSGLAVLQDEVRKYPDDAQSRYLLGEDYQHLGTQALVGREDADRAFRKAVELDPSFAPAYIHLIENAFAEGDSARAARLLEKYRRLAPGDGYSAAYAVGFALAFGDSTGRARGWADLETLQFPSHLLALWSLLSGPGTPRSALLRGELLRFASKRSDRFALLAADLFWARMGRGEMRSALQELERRSGPQEWKAGMLYTLHSWDLPVGNELLDSSVSRVDSSDILQLFSGGAYAVDRARWDEHARALSRMRANARRLHDAGDTVKADFADAAARGLEGYGWWRRGQKAKALEVLSVAQREATGWEANGYHSREVLNALFRRWLGLLLEELGRPKDALPYFESFQWYEVDPLAARDRARLYEKVGELDRAQEAYTFFIDNWQDADPELQPKLEEARAALRQLTSLRRE
jgi:DNA-binding SARP family transcriptional activator/TolB-like protein